MLTDGFDTGSTRTLNDARDEVHKADAAVHAIQYRGGFGGKTDLYGRYVVAFRPERVNLGKLPNEVRVEVARPEVSVRARKTYFAELP